MSYPEASHLHALEAPCARVADNVSGFSHLANLDLGPVSEIFPLATAYVAQLAACGSSLSWHSISMIALSRGFSNLSHFSTVFRRRYGVSPREYRNSQSSSGPA